MAVDPVRLADTMAWLVKAKNDLRGAEIDLAADPPLVEDALFHCQQAVEKSFKAFLAFHDKSFRKTHNLEELGEECLKIDPTLKGVVDDVSPLTEYAWAFRYPGPMTTPALAEAIEALESARTAFQSVLGRTGVPVP